MPSVFISYFHEDRDQAYLVNAHLRSLQIETFFDDVGLQIGDAWRDKIRNALDAASALVVLCTSSAVASTEVLFEVAYAMGRRIPVLPLLWDRSCALPAFLAGRQYLDFSDKSKPWMALTAQVRSITSTQTTVAEQCRDVGLVGIGKGRSLRERTAHIIDVLSGARPKSKLTITGRSLVDWSNYWHDIENAIASRHLDVRMALLTSMRSRTKTERYAHGSTFQSQRTGH
jgi:hypothetical protein